VTYNFLKDSLKYNANNNGYQAQPIEDYGIIFLQSLLTIKTKSMANKNRNRDSQQGRQSDIGNQQKTTQTGGQNQGGQRSNVSENRGNQNQGNDGSRQGDGGNRGNRGNRGLG
jgi:hypothetical protein